jgi:hypothetical protein
MITYDLVILFHIINSWHLIMVYKQMRLTTYVVTVKIFLYRYCFQFRKVTMCHVYDTYLIWEEFVHSDFSFERAKNGIMVKVEKIWDSLGV